ncbi:hypothetical protein LOTGIDRAFT_174356 [Lottia gigantea]|uniref:Uncharacterized protein n=1 Tax=Lottia gigantea TaxID=225164 RepID=V4AT83_LOTGI|nr:hypothetical protein LOTGIDRAFT_174356 [Lottia gigantea]ESO98100.1 hypothetical protein LOTGIDRAFT_174356 [Lottia gigantea]
MATCMALPVFISPQDFDYIVIITNQTKLKENDAVFIRCTVDSNPPASIKWFKDGDVELPTTNSNIYFISSTSCLDTGNYSCLATNSVYANQKNKSLELLVHCSPWITILSNSHSLYIYIGSPWFTILSNSHSLYIYIGSPWFTILSNSHSLYINIGSPRLDTREDHRLKVSGDIGETVELTAEIISYPGANFQWFYKDNGSDIMIGNQESYFVINNQRFINSYRSVLRTNIKSNEMYRQYYLNITNDDELSNSLQFQLISETVPDSPQDVRLLNETSDTICIEWIPGFNGGAPKSYIVQHSTDDKTWINSPAIPDSTNNGRVDYCIEGLEPDTSYYIRVIASNKYGESKIGTLSQSELPKTAPRQGASPAQLLMGRQLRTTLPTLSRNIKPRWPNLKNVRGRDRDHKDRKKRNFDYHNSSRDLKELNPGDNIIVKLDWEKRGTPGVVIRKCAQPRSYMIRTKYGLFRRNRRHLFLTNKVRFAANAFDEDFDPIDIDIRVNNHQDVNPPDPPPDIPQLPVRVEKPVLRRSGRTIVKPERYRD